MNFLKSRSKAVKLKGSTEARDQLLLDYKPLVVSVAQSIKSRLPSNIELDDLVSAGMIGLIDALRKFDFKKDIKFKTYAEFRVRGAILDELRHMDWVPRSVRDEFKRLTKARDNFEREFGRAASAEEMAQALSLTLDEYHALTQKLLGSTPSSVLSVGVIGAEYDDDVRFHSKSTGSDNLDEGDRVWVFLGEFLNQLPEKMKMVLTLYYRDDLSLKEIAHILGVTESRVCQIHVQALERLENKISLKKIKLSDVI